MDSETVPAIQSAAMRAKERTLRTCRILESSHHRLEQSQTVLAQSRPLHFFLPIVVETPASITADVPEQARSEAANRALDLGVRTLQEHPASLR